jgi:hypothetical protein
MKCRSSATRRRLNPLFVDRVITLALMLICTGVMLFILLTQAGCQSHTKVTPASSEAARTTKVRNGSVEWEVIVTPKEDAK